MSEIIGTANCDCSGLFDSLFDLVLFVTRFWSDHNTSIRFRGTFSTRVLLVDQFQHSGKV
jgi:hypothetical protein